MKVKVLREKINNVCTVELDNAQQDGQFVAHHIIAYLKSEILALLDEHEAKLRDFDAQKWFDENIFEEWTWESMLEKFVKKEILG